MDKRSFFLNGALMTAVNLALRTVSLGFGAYIAASIGAEGVGLYTLVNTVYSFALTFATSGISLTVTRLVAENIGRDEDSEVGRTITGAVIYALLFSGAATLILSVASGSIATLILSDTRAILPLGILSLSLIPAALTSVFSGYFVGVRRVVPNAIIQVLGQLMRVGATIALLAGSLGETTETAIAALAIGTTATELVIFIFCFIAFAIDRLRTKSTGSGGAALLPVARTALPLGISAYIRAALLSLEHSLIPRRLILHGETQKEALSLFGIVHGMSLPMILYPMSPLSSFSGLLVPEFAEADARGAGERASRIASRALAATLTYASLAAVILFSFSEEIGYTVYSSYDAGVYIALLAPVVPLMYLDHVTDSILKGIGEHVYSMWVNIADSTLSVILVFILTPLMGIGGYAVVIIVMELFNFVMSIIRLMQRIRISLDLVRSLLVPIGSAFLAAGITRLLFVALGSIADAGQLSLRIIFSVAAFIIVNMAASGIYDIIRGERRSSPKGKSRL